MKLKEDIAVVRSLGVTPAGLLCVYYSFLVVENQYGTVPSQPAMDGGTAFTGVLIGASGALGGILVVHGLAGAVDLRSTGTRILRYPLATTLVTLLHIGYIAYLRSYGVGQILSFVDWLPAAIVLGSIATAVNESWLFLLRTVRRRL